MDTMHGMDFVGLTETEAAVVIAHGFDHLVERTSRGFVAPQWARDLAQDEIRSWTDGEVVDWNPVWKCVARSAASEDRLPAVA